MIDEALKTDDKALFKAATKLESKSKIENMIKLAQSEVPITMDELDQNKWKLNVGNGILDLQSGKLEPHSFAAYHSKITSVDYTETAEAPLWKKFLNQIFEENEKLIEFIQKAVGYALTGSVKEQVIFILHGYGANGKSTFVKVIQALLGEYAQQMPASSLLTKGNPTIPNDIARLKGARFVGASEIDEGRCFSESLVKQLTGEDKISARFLFQEYFEFDPTHKIFLTTNHKPEIKGDDDAIWRRIRLIPFYFQIPPEEQDKELGYKLKEELPGILNWSIEGLRKWQDEGLEPPPIVINATNEYRAEMDVLDSFIQDCCNTGPEHKVPSSKLYEYYRQWAQKNSEIDLSQKKFSMKMSERGYGKQRKGSGMMWNGINIKMIMESVNI